MKKIIILSAFLLMNFAAIAQTKIGTIDAEYILAQLPEIEQVNQALQVYDKELQQKLDSTITAYETLVKDYQANSTTFTEEVKQAKETQLIGLENDIKGFRQKAGVMLQLKRNELTNPLYEKINSAMLKVIEEENFTQIFHAGGNALAFSSEEYDITLKVLNMLGIEPTSE